MPTSYSNDSAAGIMSFSNDSKPNSGSYLVAKWDDSVAKWDSGIYSWGSAQSVVFTNDTEPS